MFRFWNPAVSVFFPIYCRSCTSSVYACFFDFLFTLNHTITYFRSKIFSAYFFRLYNISLPQDATKFPFSKANYTGWLGKAEILFLNSWLKKELRSWVFCSVKFMRRNLFIRIQILILSGVMPWSLGVLFIHVVERNGPIYHRRRVSICKIIKKIYFWRGLILTKYTKKQHIYFLESKILSPEASKYGHSKTSVNMLVMKYYRVLWNTSALNNWALFNILLPYILPFTFIFSSIAKAS